MAEGQLGSLVVSLSADIANFKSDMGKAVKSSQESANSIAKAFDGVQSTIGGIGKAFGVATALLAGGAMFKDTINTTKEVASEIVKLKNSLGISAEEASVLRVALDDVFLTADDMAGASSRITKQLVKNEEAFKNLRVSTRDSNDNFRSTTEIMTDTNSKLLEFKKGTDLNVEGMKIYGKGWEEAKKTLKLTSEGMTEAKKRAEELHLVISEDGLKAAKDYKLAMKDIDDVTESLKTNLGLALIPELTRVSVAFGESAAKGIPLFITGLHNVEAEITRMAMLTDKAGGTITTMMYYLSGGKFTDTGKWWAEQNKMYEQRYSENEKILIKLANAEVGLDENGKPFAKGKIDKSGKTSTGGEKKESDTATADRKKVDYLKAHEESKAALIKAAADYELEVNKQSYDTGLTDFRTYLETKHALSEEADYAELSAKRKELKAAKDALADLKPSVGKGGKSSPDKDAANRFEALKKVEDATKAVTEAESKLNLERLKNNSETVTLTADTIRTYKEEQAVFLDMQGDYVGAAEIRKRLDEESIKRAKTIADAMSGDESAMAAYWAQEAADQKRVQDAYQKTSEVAASYRNLMSGLKVNLLELDGKYSKAKLEQLENDHTRELESIEKSAIAEVWTNERKNAAIKASDDKYAKQKAVATSAWTRMVDDGWTQVGSIMSGQMSSIAGMMNKSNADQFAAYKALMIAQATIATSMAIVGIMAAESKLGMFAIPLAFTAGAIGAAQIALIASEQMPARAAGGPVNSGTSYLVGEKGPEIFTPGATGQITSNDKLNALSGGGPTVNVTVVHQIAPGVPEAARAEMMRLMPYLNQNAVAAVKSAMSQGQFQRYA